MAPTARRKRKLDVKKLITSLLLIAAGVGYLLRNKDPWIIAIAIGLAVGGVMLVIATTLRRRGSAADSQDGQR